MKTQDKRYPFLGSYVDALTMQETLERIKSCITDKNPMQHVVVNAGKIVMMHNNPQLLEIVNGCSLINADGQAVVWAGRLLDIPVPERVAGVDLMQHLLAMAEDNHYRVYLLGAKEEVLERAVSVIRETYPRLQLAGYHHGYFDVSEEETITRRIAESNADILFVGMSSPKKEFWLHQHLQGLHTPFCMGVGGSLDIWALTKRRAPRWMQAAGLEWFFRFIQEPSRMWKRYLIGNFVFLSLVAKDRLIRKRGSSK